MSWKYPPLPVTATLAAKRKRNWGRPDSRPRSCRWPPGRCETQSQLPPRCSIRPGRPSRPCHRFPLPHLAFTALPSSSHCRVSARAALPRSSVCFPQSAFFLSLPHSLCESHRARAVLLCPRSPAPSLAQSPGPQPPEDKAFPPVASPARRDSLFTSGFCAQCFCSLVSDSSRG